eukprot:COSAG04_NODE_2740_length_3655_cov_1.514623_5_plen_174_part_01
MVLSRSVALSDSLALKQSLPQVWQYNECWPTGGWGSIEYGFPSRGQVIGGRWKPLHHWYQQSLYADVMATCGQGGICYVKNDGCREFTGTLNVTSIDFASGNATVLKAQAVSLPAGPGAIEWFNLTASPFLLSASTGGTGQARQPCAAKPCGASHPGRTYCPCDPTAHQCDQTG